MHHYVGIQSNEDGTRERVDLLVAEPQRQRMEDAFCIDVSGERKHVRGRSTWFMHVAELT